MPKLTPGSLLLFHGKSAVLNALAGDKLDIRTEGGGAKSVRLKDVEFLHPGPVSRLPPPEPCAPDIEGTLELMGDETLSFGDLTELLYSESGAGAFYAAWNLVNAGVYFTGSVEGGVKARSKEEIDSILNAAKAKEESKNRHAALLQRIRNNALLPEDRPFMAEIEQVAYGINESSRLMHDLEIEAIPEKAHSLLLKLGIWEDTVNPYPVRNGIELKDPVLEIGDLPAEEREDLTGMKSYAIDNEGSDDPDDAIGFSEGLLWVHVADPAAVVVPDSELDLVARANGENLYLPEKVLHMLPPGMTEVFGLGLQETSPALSFGIRIDDEGAAHLEKMCLSKVKVERLTYETARVKMEQPDFIAMRGELDRFRRYREANGALFIRLPEVDLFVRDGKVEIQPVTMTAERELVANAMLAAGAAVGAYCDEKGIAMPFAAQAQAENVPEETESMAGMYQLRKCCSPGFVTHSAEPHSGLGIKAYVRVTSPLRRYVDLLAHQQVRKILKGEEPFSSDEITERYPEAEKEGVIRRKTERISKEFWTLVYLKQKQPWSGEAVVVHHPDDRTAFLIPELAYEFKMRGYDHLSENEAVTVSLHTVDIAGMTARFSVKRKAEEL